MTKKQLLMLFMVFSITHLLSLVGFVIIGDFYPHLETLGAVLGFKSFFSGVTSFAVGFYIFDEWKNLK